jgi:hypothetical protein
VAVSGGGAGKERRARRDVRVNNLCGKVVLSAAIDLGRLCAVEDADPRVAGARRESNNFGCVVSFATQSAFLGIRADAQTVLVRGASDYGDVMQDICALNNSATGVGVAGTAESQHDDGEPSPPPLFVHMIVLSGCLGIVFNLEEVCRRVHDDDALVTVCVCVSRRLLL